MEKVEIVELKEEHVNQATDVITRSFLGLNDIWKGYNPQYQDVFPVVRGKVIPSIQHGWSFVLTKNQRVIGVSIEYDLVDYLVAPTMPHSSKLFTTLGKYGSQLEASLKESNPKRGQAIYGLYGVIDPDHGSQGHSLKFWWMNFAMGKVAGWKTYYTRASNPQSYRMLKKLGAKQVGVVELNEPELGQKQKLWLMKIDLTKEFPTYSMLLQATQKPKL